MNSSVSAYGGLARVLAASQAISAQFAELTRQSATGKKSEQFGGLGTLAKTSIDLRADMARRETYSAAIKDGLARASTMQQVLGRLGTITGDMAKAALQLSGNGSSDAESTAVVARGALQEVVALLNSQLNGEYLFSGADVSHPAVPDPAGVLTGSFFTKIGVEIASLGTATLATVAQNTIDIAKDSQPAVSIFSSFLETAAPADPTVDPPGGKGAPLRTVPAGDGIRIALDLRANENGQARPEADPPGTGSFIRDILRDLAILGNIDGSTAAKADFAGLMQNVARGLQSAGRVLAEERGAIGMSEQRLEAAQDDHAAMNVILGKQLASVEDVDMAETLTRLQLVKTQLESSYQVIAAVKELSLAKFI